ncbi:MAG: recombinase family protein, partial [Burkholderiaceae bacterium]|nr:recombinase family protein [Burkholderiaceae bacterium]
MKNFESIHELISRYKEDNTPTDGMKKVALYMRYSSANQNEESIDYQRRKILSFCYNNHYLPTKEYIDEAFTGTNDKRPAFQRMLADARDNPPWEELLVFNLSRFCRNAWMGIKYFMDIRALGLDITSVVENFPKTSEGRFMESFYHLFNAYYSEITATHTREGMRNKALKSLHCGGTPPLGYDVDSETKEYVLNEKEAEIVKKIFDLYEQNRSYQSIADELNNAG